MLTVRNVFPRMKLQFLTWRFCEIMVCHRTTHFATLVQETVMSRLEGSTIYTATPYVKNVEYVNKPHLHHICNL